MVKLTLSQEEKHNLDIGFAGVFGGEPTHYFSAPGTSVVGFWLPR